MAPFNRLTVRPGIVPMEAKLVETLPDGEGWQFEPKWDGFRCLVFKEGEDVELRSKSSKTLAIFPRSSKRSRACGRNVSCWTES